MLRKKKAPRKRQTSIIRRIIIPYTSLLRNAKSVTRATRLSFRILNSIAFNLPKFLARTTRVIHAYTRLFYTYMKFRSTKVLISVLAQKKSIGIRDKRHSTYASQREVYTLSIYKVIRASRREKKRRLALKNREKQERERERERERENDYVNCPTCFCKVQWKKIDPHPL